MGPTIVCTALQEWGGGVGRVVGPQDLCSPDRLTNRLPQVTKYPSSLRYLGGSVLWPVSYCLTFSLFDWCL